MSNNKCAFDLDEKTAKIVAYAGAFVTGIILLVSEKENKKVRFHALQSTLLFGALGIVQLVLGMVFGILSWIPIIGGLFGLVMWIVSGVNFVVWAFMLLMAVQEKDFKVPILGEICEQQVNK